MIKRAAALLLIAALLISAGGCSSFLEGERLEIKDHVDDDYTVDVDNGKDIVEAETYLGIRNAILDFVKGGVGLGVIKVSGYDGDLADAISQACLEVTRETAVGAYAVDYMTHSYSRILSYYEVKVYINYRCTPEQIENILYLNYAVDARLALLDALERHVEYLAMSITSSVVTEQYFPNYLNEYYLNNPMFLAALPELRITAYGAPSTQKILEVEIEYPYTLEREREMRAAMKLASDDLIARIEAASNDELALKLCLGLIEYADGSSSGGGTLPLAYGALVERKANSEGFARAFKLLCNEAGVPCTVVSGRAGGLEHWWNIIKLGEDFYHVDPFACGERGVEAGFLKSDADMLGSYWWDTERYNPCAGTLTYAALMERLNPAAPEVSPSPEISPAPEE